MVRFDVYNGLYCVLQAKRVKFLMMASNMMRILKMDENIKKILVTSL